MRKSIFFRTFDDEDTPGFKIFLVGSLGFGALTFLGALGTWNVWAGVAAWLVTGAISYLIGLVVNVVAEGLSNLAYFLRRR